MKNYFNYSLLFAINFCAILTLNAQQSQSDTSDVQQSGMEDGLAHRRVSTFSSAQNTSYLANIQHFSTEKGLSHREVLFIFHDRDGMTWIATPNGLNRFDGYHFKHFLGRKERERMFIL